jgi:hypothetical protein
MSKKPGPKVQNIYFCKCCQPAQEFQTAAKKCKHEHMKRMKTN